MTGTGGTGRGVSIGIGHCKERTGTMPKFLFSAGYTTAGIEGLQREGGTGRKAMFSAMIEKLGGSLEAFYYAFGPDDLIMIADLPDDESAVAMSMEVAKAGAIGIRTVVLVSPETLDRAGNIEVDYRVPGA
ncbi:MAG: GYD domain-containing protein [Chloroflexi bacterium]|nr:GYD domain-containing protein [Chloroflexota bacterium]MXY13571.1 GYD domain-containing protein [Chloroflexota bacterium]MYB15428.1 GYD domain-containing protein [Chloroflexota bacterium]